MNLTSMIDIVFLLLIYFLVTTALQKDETQVTITLPSDSPPTDSKKQPNEAVVNILSDATITMDGVAYDHFDSREMPQLTEALRRLKVTGDSAGLVTFVTIQADEDSPHQRSIDVLNACAAADINSVTFGTGGG